MKDDAWPFAAIITGIVAAAAAVIIPIHTAWSSGTERLTTCVENGGAYVHVADTGYFECQKEN